MTKTLHWLTVLALAAQFAVGWTMDPDARYDAADAVLDAREDACESENDAQEERCKSRVEREEAALDADEDAWARDVLGDIARGDVLNGGLALPEVHVLLGLSIMLLGAARLTWRSTTPLPPWSENLGPRERKLEGRLEQALLTSLFLVPATGLLLATGLGSVGLHVAVQFAFLGVLAIHVGLVLRHTVIRRERHLSRML